MISADVFLKGYMIAIIVIMSGWGVGDLIRYLRRKRHGV